MWLIRMVAKTVQEGLFWVLGIALALYVWVADPATIVWATDLNLAGVKWVCKFLPPYYGALAESGLRLGLGIDKTLLSLEGIAVMKFFFFVISKISHGLYYLLFGNFGRVGTPAP